MRVDAHQHFWRVDRGDYGWLTAESLPALYRDFLPEDLAPLIAAERVDKTVLVQAAPTVAETEFLLGIADATPFVAGVVGWVDLEAADAPARIAHLAGNPKLLGLRPMLQDLSDDAWILRPGLTPAWAAMKAHGLRFDVLIFPRHLAYAMRFLAQHSDLPAVIDHGATPFIARGEIEPWANDMREIGKNTPAFCKLSGLVTEAGSGWSVEKLKPYVDILIEAFGPRRLMWGSDWPVLTLAGSYESWCAAARQLTAHLTADERNQIFGDTAARFYGIAP